MSGESDVRPDVNGCVAGSAADGTALDGAAMVTPPIVARAVSPGAARTYQSNSAQRDPDADILHGHKALVVEPTGEHDGCHRV